MMLLFLIFNQIIATPDIGERPGVVFLGLSAGARAAGMGSSSTGCIGEPTVIQYNPGAIGFFDKFTIAIMNQGPSPGLGRLLEEIYLYPIRRLYKDSVNLSPEPPWLGWLNPEMRYIYGVGLLPLKNKGTLGLNYTYFTSGLTDVVDPNGNYIGSYLSYDYAIGLSYGKTISRFGIGTTVKYIYSFLYPDWIELVPYGDAHSFAIDLGLVYRFKGVGLGFALQNLGPRIAYAEDLSARLPTRFRWGVSFEPIIVMDSILFKNQLYLSDISLPDLVNIKFNLDRSYDFKYPEDDIWHCSGWEFRFLKHFSYRFGAFEWMGKSSGIGINLGIYSIDVARFYDDAFHIQITIDPKATSFSTDNYPKRKLLTIGSIFIFPGAPQFYKGKGIKGALFFIPGLILGNTSLTSDDENKRFFSRVGIVGLYLLSAVDAMVR